MGEKTKKNLTMDNYCWVTDKRQTRPLVRKSAQQRQCSEIQTELISVCKCQGGLDGKTYWLIDRQSERDLRPQCAASEEDMALAITKIVIKLMKEDGK
jgi:hypothetical protein